MQLTFYATSVSTIRGPSAEPQQWRLIPPAQPQKHPKVGTARLLGSSARWLLLHLYDGAEKATTASRAPGVHSKESRGSPRLFPICKVKTAFVTIHYLPF